MFKNLFTFFIVIILYSNVLPSFAEEKIVSNGWKVNNIIITGNQRIERETILSKITLLEGSKFQDSKIDKTLKELFATGLFKDVKITANRAKNNVTITVIENPIVNKIDFEGTKAIKKGTLQSEISLKPRSNFNKSKLQNDINKIKDIYNFSGRFSATIQPKIIELPQNRVNLVFEINEGQKTVVRKIVFIGNDNFKDKELKSLLNTQEKKWYKFFFNKDTYDPQKLEFDKELLRLFYTSKGYADFKVLTSLVEVTRDKKSFIITFTLDEGEKYQFGNIAAQSYVSEIADKEIMPHINIKQGELYNSNKIQETIDKIIKYMSDRGYAFVDINPEISQDHEKKQVHLNFIINKSKKTYINNINITGNSRTLDKVIRREMRIAEKDPYNSSLLERSEMRIRNLDYFDKVDFAVKKGDYDDQVDVDINVKEKSTAQINLGFGYSTLDGLLAKLGYTDYNFLGKGQELGASISKAHRSTNFELSLADPYFLDKDLLSSVELFSTNQDPIESTSFKSNSVGITFRVGYNITEYLNHSLRYSINKSRIIANKEAAKTVLEQQGRYITSLIGQTFLYDKTNSKFRPNKGYFIKLNQDLAGFGGNVDFLRHELNGSYYIPIKKAITLKLSGNISHIKSIGDNTRINDRFFLGGDDLKGFQYAGVGPRDKVTGDALGGNLYYLMSAELMFPLGLSQELDINGVVFMNAGGLHNTELSKEDKKTINYSTKPRAAVGVGVNLSSPMGPIGVYYSKTISKQSFDKSKTILLIFQTPF